MSKFSKVNDLGTHPEYPAVKGEKWQDPKHCAVFPTATHRSTFALNKARGLPQHERKTSKLHTYQKSNLSSVQ